MPRTKKPLAEGDANPKTQKSPDAQKKSSPTTNKSPSQNKSSLMEVANNITKTHGKKRSHDDETTPNKKAKVSETSTSKKEADPKKTDSKKPESKKVDTKKSDNDKGDELDVSDVTLDGEAKGKVPIFDTCDDIRTKINAHLRKHAKVTKAGFARTLNHTYEVAKDSKRKATSAQLTRFLEKKGPTMGATSPIYYAAYVYFEKLRVKHDKPKSKKRQEMEDVHPATGCGTEHEGTQSLTMHVSEVLIEDKYGIKRIEKKKGF